MNRITVLLLMSIALLYSAQMQEPPSSLNAVKGKSVYVAPMPSLDILGEQKIQTEDQNCTGYGNAK